MNPSTIGIIGLGIIGSRVAQNVAAAGHPIALWNRTPHDTPHFLPNVSEVAKAAQILQIFVRDDEALLSVIDQMLPALTAGHLILNHATVSPGATRAAAERLAQNGVGFLDCPFTGSKMAAQNGKLVYYVGGEVSLLERARPILEASSAKILHVGPIGHATLLKIATNLVSAVTVKGLAEALALTKAHGVDPAHLLATLEPNANFSPLIAMKLPAMIQGEHEAHFALKNMLKDADYALALAAEKGLPLPALEVMADAMRTAAANGNADLDFAVISRNN